MSFKSDSNASINLLAMFAFIILMEIKNLKTVKDTQPNPNVFFFIHTIEKCYLTNLEQYGYKYTQPIIKFKTHKLQYQHNITIYFFCFFFLN